MKPSQIRRGITMLAPTLLGCLLSSHLAHAQSSPTLGVPRQGRVVPTNEWSAGPANQLLAQTPLPANQPLSQPRLLAPKKSSNRSLPSTLLSHAWTYDCRQESPQTIAGAVLTAGDSPNKAPPTPSMGGPSIIRGSVDENYLRGVPDAGGGSTLRGGFTAPWDWLHQNIHNSPLGPYCEWFHIKNTFQSDHAFDEFISPVTNPFFFEDPRALTELRPVFIFQNTPKRNPLFAGGNIEMFALQARLALNERLSIVMPKLGFIAFQPDAPSPLGDEIGFSEIVIGPKLTFWRDDSANILAAFGVHFEIAAGGSDVFQNTGSGSVVPYLTFGKELLDNLHFLGAIGYRAGFDSDRSDSFFVSLHADYEFYRILYPFIEVTWFHYTSGGKVLVANFEGGDLFNFGSTQAGGEDIITLGVGGRVKILGDQLQAGAGFEFPLTKSKDILDWRLTIDLIWRY